MHVIVTRDTTGPRRRPLFCDRTSLHASSVKTDTRDESDCDGGKTHAYLTLVMAFDKRAYRYELLRRERYRRSRRWLIVTVRRVDYGHNKRPSRELSYISTRRTFPYEKKKKPSLLHPIFLAEGLDI